MKRRTVSIVLFSAFTIPHSAFSQSPIPDPRSLLGPPPVCTLRLHVAPYADRAERNAATVDALRAPAVKQHFTHVLLTTTSWQESPDALADPFIRHAINLCDDIALPIIWGRSLWIADPARVPGGTAAFVDAQDSPAYYTAAIDVVKQEARLIGAVGTFLDIEPYGKNGPQKWLKTATLTPGQRCVMRWAVRQAVQTVGPVTLLEPGSRESPDRYNWPLLDLASTWGHTKTYKAKPPDWQFPPIRPPPGVQFRLDLWGMWVGSYDDVCKPADVAAWLADFPVIRKRYPECQGLFIYIEAKDFAETLRNW